MTPVGKFEFWTQWDQWGLAIVLDFGYKRAWAIIGPFNFGFNPYA